MDAKKLRDLPVGTELLVRGRKIRAYTNGSISLELERHGGGSEGDSITVYPSEVECIAPPKPEPIKVGDTVVSKMGGHLFHQVLGIHEKFVWLKPIRETGQQFDEGVSTHYLEDFEKADINEPHFRYP